MMPISLLCGARGSLRKNSMSKMITVSSGEIELGCDIGHEAALSEDKYKTIIHVAASDINVGELAQWIRKT